jgi:hypothetical protein
MGEERDASRRVSTVQTPEYVAMEEMTLFKD